MRKGERPSAEQAAQWIASLGETLAQIHNHGYVHRDIKPDNVLFDRKGQVYLSDFGLAASALEQLSEDSDVRGTISFMAPEQARGQRIDRQADIYSLGVVLYYLLALPYVAEPRLALPYLANNSEEYWTALGDPNQQARTLPPEVPGALAEIVEKYCLPRDKSQRFRSALELSQALRRWLRSVSWSRRGLLTAAGGAAVSALAASGFYFGSQWLTGDTNTTQHSLPQEHPDPVAVPPQVATDDQSAIRVQNLLHPSASHIADWSIDTSDDSLLVHTRQRLLLAVGIHNQEATDLEVSLSPFDWQGECGLFFGHTRKPGERNYYQSISLVKFSSGQVRLRCFGNEYPARDPGGTHSASQVDEWVTRNLKLDCNVLRLKLVKGELQALFFNEIDLTGDVVKTWKTSTRGGKAKALGEFGCYCDSCPCKFSNFVLNGIPVNLKQ